MPTPGLALNGSFERSHQLHTVIFYKASWLISRASACFFFFVVQKRNEINSSIFTCGVIGFTRGSLCTHSWAKILLARGPPAAAGEGTQASSVPAGFGLSCPPTPSFILSHNPDPEIGAEQ